MLTAHAPEKLAVEDAKCQMPICHVPGRLQFTVVLLRLEEFVYVNQFGYALGFLQVGALSLLHFPPLLRATLC